VVAAAVALLVVGPVVSGKRRGVRCSPSLVRREVETLLLDSESGHVYRAILPQ
jgi:hypothetical protein